MGEIDKALGRLPWEGDEAVLDVGCGGGAALLAAARHAPTGRLVGVDSWPDERTSPTVTLANARAAGVIERVEEIRTLDCRRKRGRGNPPSPVPC